jgi:hypothetical protein
MDEETSSDVVDMGIRSSRTADCPVSAVDMLDNGIGDLPSILRPCSDLESKPDILTWEMGIGVFPSVMRS